MTKIISLYNFKGGCSKTSSAVLLADYFEKKGKKILVIDFDPQANISLVYFEYEELINNSGYAVSVYDFFENKVSLDETIRRYNDNIDVITSNLQLGGKSNIDTLELLKIKSEFLKITENYDLVIIDCPPALNSLSRLGLLLSNHIMIPILPEPFSYYGLSNMLSSIDDIIPYNKDFISYKVFFAVHKSHKTILRENYMDSIRDQLNESIFINTIPDFIGIVERSVNKYNIFDVYKRGKAIQQIKKLMKEIEKEIF